MFSVTVPYLATPYCHRAGLDRCKVGVVPLVSSENTHRICRVALLQAKLTWFGVRRNSY